MDPIDFQISQRRHMPRCSINVECAGREDPVEMRDNGVEDFGRKHSLAWYTIMGCGLVQEERVVRGESS